ncbi:MAG TPA: APC family permease [Acidimicrobiales bacterium]|nr:APC family permease [Acidimicrobiales bacterium]
MTLTPEITEPSSATGSSPDSSPTASTTAGQDDLARRSATGFEVFGQSLAATGPSIAIAGTVAIVFLSAGRGVIWSYVLATFVVVLVGYSIAVFARRTAAAGSLYTYTASGLGRGTAFAGGWGLIFGYLGIAAACLAGAALYLGAFITKLGVNGESRAWQIPLIVAFLVLAEALTIRGIRISTHVAVVLEIVSLVAIGVLVVALFVHYGAHFDTGQLKATGSSATGIALGTVLAVGAFVGFESSASLGIEAKNPHRAIPRAILFTALAAGILYIVSAYAQVLGFPTPAALAAESAPLNGLASTAGIGWLAYYLDLAVAVSAFGVVAASLNAAARGLYSLGREEILPKDFARSHSTYKTPHVALLVLGPVAVAAPVILVAEGITPLDIFGYIGTVASYGYLLAYVLVAISAPIFLARRKVLTPLPVVVSVLATAAIGYVIYKNLVPVPAAPYDYFPYVFVAWVVIGLAWYLVLKVRDPARAAKLGTFQEQAEADLESRIAAELTIEAPGAERTVTALGAEAPPA